MEHGVMERTAGARPARRLPLTPDVETKYRALMGHLEGLESAIVAFSGGVDSSLVAFLTHRALGERALAVTSGSASLTRDDLALTRRLAGEWGMAHRVVQTREIENADYRANPVNRCYFCKTSLYGELATLAADEGYRAVLSGINADDLGDHRPGLQAAAEHGVRAPLADSGLDKDDIRRLARHLGLHNAEKPQAACLASRVPYGTAISLDLLSQIERAESALRALGLGQLRVRHHDRVARIEVPEEAFALVLERRAEIVQAVTACGYGYVTLDLQGFRSGSLNEGVAGVGDGK